MLMVDLRKTTARISMREIQASGRRYVSNPVAFSYFMSGVKLSPVMLLDKDWQNSGAASSRFAYFRTVMHHLLPRVYDVRHLEQLGGRFALRLTRVGDYTVMALNRRVVTLAGLPKEDETGKPVFDAEMRADVFMALCNGMLAELAEKTLKALETAKAAQSETV